MGPGENEFDSPDLGSGLEVGHFKNSQVFPMCGQVENHRA